MKPYVPVLLMAPALALANGDTPLPAAKIPQVSDCSLLYKKKDYPRARDACLASAEKGEVEARYLLGRLYEDGLGVSKDAATAVKWYRLAAESGHAASQRHLAGAYYYGLGVEKKDEAQALYWLRRAADGGDVHAQKQMAIGYERGIGGLAKDEKLARQWRERAARGGRL